MPTPIGGNEQATALKSYRRHLEKERRCTIRDYTTVCRQWIVTGLSTKWRCSFNKTRNG